MEADESEIIHESNALRSPGHAQGREAALCIREVNAFHGKFFETDITSWSRKKIHFGALPQHHAIAVLVIATVVIAIERSIDVAFGPGSRFR